MKTVVPLGEWLPDVPSATNPGLEVAKNVHSIVGGYAPFRSLVGSGQTVTGQVFGAQQMFDNSGNSVIVGGTLDRLFIRRSTITQTTGLSSIGASEAWDFAQFNDFVVATGNANAPQYLTDIDSDNTWSALPGSPPNAKRCARVADFLMLGNLASFPTRIKWSHFNAPTSSWADSRLTQAGYATLPVAFGEVQKIVGGRYAIVFQQRGIHRLTYVGPPTVFKADVISAERGAVAPFSVVPVGYLTYFLAQDGFYLTNGSAIEPIGGQRVNKWFFDTIQQSKIKEVQGAVDWQNRSVIWSFTSESSDERDTLIIYNYVENRWSYASVNVGWLVSSTLDGVDLDSLDAIYTDLDQIPVSLDSETFKSKDRRLAGFVTGATTSEYSTFTGPPLEATWETGEIQPDPGRRVFVSAVAPQMIADDWDATVLLKTRSHLGVQTGWPAVATGWGGFAPVRAEGHRMAIQLVKPAGEWTEATGMEVRFKTAGER